MFTYDPTTDVGRVRRTIPDKDEANAFWTDAEIESFLVDEDNNWRRATALAIETMASDDLLVLKVVKVQNIETSLDRMMSALLKRAKQLRDDAAVEEANAGDAFEVAEVIVNDFQWRERVLGQALRGQL